MVEWHSVGVVYRVSFDVRADASRFILLGPPKVSLFTGHSQPNLLTKGLIFESFRGVEVLCDSREWAMPAAVEQEIARLWLVMRDRLQIKAAP